MTFAVFLAMRWGAVFGTCLSYLLRNPNSGATITLLARFPALSSKTRLVVTTEFCGDQITHSTSLTKTKALLRREHLWMLAHGSDC